MKICVICQREHDRKKNPVCSTCSTWYNRYLKKRKCIDYFGGKCSVCGISDLECLEFHHIDPSTKNSKINGLMDCGWRELIDELKKCELLCSNCHKKHHYKYKKDVIDYYQRSTTTVLKRKSNKPYKPRHEKRKYPIPPREELEKLLWEMPSSGIAKKYNVSPSVVRKWCQCYELSKPNATYWLRERSRKAI
jgi:hypothetical protein